MTDIPPDPVPAPVVAPMKPRAAIDINTICLVLIGVVVLASLIAVYARVDPRTVAIVAGGPVTALFGLVNRSAAE
jgi:hypothetical protein